MDRIVAIKIEKQLRIITKAGYISISDTYNKYSSGSVAMVCELYLDIPYPKLDANNIGHTRIVCNSIKLLDKLLSENLPKYTPIYKH